MTLGGSARWTGAGLVASLLLAAAGSAQERSVEPAEVLCPSVLGVGANSQTPFCDILVQVEPDLGIQIVLPPRRGEATLSFNLHNRHTYSQQEERGRACVYAIHGLDCRGHDGGEVIGEGVVLSEFRTVADLVDRVTGGAGPRAVSRPSPPRVWSGSTSRCRQMWISSRSSARASRSCVWTVAMCSRWSVARSPYSVM